jgi:acyl carrier protein
MGLDGVELLMELEETFNFQISDDEAGAVRTAGDLYRLVLSRLRRKTSERCVSSAAFYRLRRALASVLGVPRSGVRLDRPFEEFVPVASRHADWKRLQEAMVLRLPPLYHPRHLVHGLVVLSGVLALAAAQVVGLWPLRAFSSLLDLPIGIISVACLFLLFLGVGLRLTEPWAVGVPPSCATVRGTAQTLADLNYGKLAKQVGALDEAEVWRIVRDRVADATGAAPEKVTEDAQLVKDLGLD